MSSPDPDRTRLERLIAAADRVATQPVPPPPDRTRSVTMASLALIGVGALILGLAMCSGGDRSTLDTSTLGTTATTVVPTVPPTTGQSAGSTTTIPTIITLPPTPSTTSATASTTPGPSTTFVPTPGQPVRSANYADGRLRLTGAVPDSRTATSLMTKWKAAFGDANVSQEFVIAIGVPPTDTEPLLAPDTMQFPTGSAELQPPALAMLDRLAALLAQNPAVTLDIDGYIDSSGNPADDQQLTDFRVGAVVIYLAGQGIDPARLRAVGHGSSKPVADEVTETGRAQNRRIEFTVHNLLP